MAGHGRDHRSPARAAAFLALAALLAEGCDQSRTIVYPLDAPPFDGQFGYTDAGPPIRPDAAAWDSGSEADTGAEWDGGEDPDGSR